MLARKIEPAIEKRIQAQLRTKKGMLAIAKDLKVGTGTVQRVKREMEDSLNRTFSLSRRPW